MSYSIRQTKLQKFCYDIFESPTKNEQSNYLLSGQCNPTQKNSAFFIDPSLIICNFMAQINLLLENFSQDIRE